MNSARKTGETIGILIIRPWIIMLVLGAVAHLLNLPRLAIGYFACFFLNLLFMLIRAYLI